MKLKVEHFSRLWHNCLFWLNKRNTTHNIAGTSAVYWFAWIVESGVYRTAIKLQKNVSRNCSIWNKFYTVGINFGIVWSLFYYWTSKLINLLLFPSFSISHNLCANFPNYKGSGPQIQMNRKITGRLFWDFRSSWSKLGSFWRSDDRYFRTLSFDCSSVNLYDVCFSSKGSRVYSK